MVTRDFFIIEDSSGGLFTQWYLHHRYNSFNCIKFQNEKINVNANKDKSLYLCLFSSNFMLYYCRENLHEFSSYASFQGIVVEIIGSKLH
jgi:hypothetical protein